MSTVEFLDQFLEQIAQNLGGEIESLMLLPDGDGAAVVSYPLPSDHWIYETDKDGYCGEPPMPMRIGTGDPEREKMIKMLREAGKYAVKASTQCGRNMNFDPDALIKNMIVGLLGYYTEDGLSRVE